VFGWERIMYGRVDIGAAEYDNTVSTPEIFNPTSERLVVFPNPSCGTFTVRVEKSSPGILRMYSSTGELVEERQVRPDARDLRITRPDLRPGLYVLQIQGSTGTLSQKLLIQ